MAYDRIDWHSGGDYPKGLPHENGGTHIGMFLAWAINRNLEGELHHDSEREEQALKSVRDRTITGRDFLINQCDEKFWDEDLNEEGNNFAKWYYEPNKEGHPTYFEDYCHALEDGSDKSAYHYENNWENYDKVAAILDRRFDEWKRGVIPERLAKPGKSKPWWKLW